MPDTQRLAYKLKLPIEMQQLANLLLDTEGFCACGRLIGRWEGKFLLAAVMPSKEMTTLAAYCQPCSQILNSTLIRISKTNYMDKTESISPLKIPGISHAE